jgi:hypothetical protein
MNQMQHEMVFLPPELKAGVEKSKLLLPGCKNRAFHSQRKSIAELPEICLQSNDLGTYGDLKGLWFIRDNMIRDLLG